MGIKVTNKKGHGWRGPGNLANIKSTRGADMSKPLRVKGDFPIKDGPEGPKGPMRPGTQVPPPGHQSGTPVQVFKPKPQVLPPPANPNFVIPPKKKILK